MCDTFRKINKSCAPDKKRHFPSRGCLHSAGARSRVQKRALDIGMLLLLRAWKMLGVVEIVSNVPKPLKRELNMPRRVIPRFLGVIA